MTFKPHNALEDARASAFVLKEGLLKGGYRSLDEAIDSLGFSVGELYIGGYKPFSGATKKGSGVGLKAKDITTDFTEFDENHFFFNKTVTFTGTLLSMKRAEAMQKVVDVGGQCADTVKQITNFLVVGVQDFKRFRDGNKSSKMKKAETLISDGQDLEIITEDDFVKML